MLSVCDCQEGRQAGVFMAAFTEQFTEDREKQQAVALQASTKLDFQLVIKFH